MVEKDCLNRYFTYCRLQKNLDAKTLKAYRIDLAQYLDCLPEGKPSADRADLERYVEQLVDRYKIATVKRKCAALKAYYRYLVYEEVLPQSPFDKVRLQFRQENLLPRTIEPQAIEALLNAAYAALENAGTQGRYLECLRDAAVLELLFCTGIRVSELCHITLESLDLVNQTVLIYGKGSKERLLYLSVPQVVAVLQEYRERRVYMGGPEAFFLNRSGKRLSEQSVRGIINKYSRRAGQAGHYTPHMFRHSFATYLWDQCGDIYEVKDILGHSSIKTTERYVHASFERQKKLLTAAHPRNQLRVREHRV